MSSESSQKLQLDISGSEDEDSKLTRDASPDTSLDSSRVLVETRTRSMSAKGSRLLEIRESRVEEEEEKTQGQRRGSLPDLKTEYKRRRKLPLGRILSPSHIDGFRKWALGDKFLDELEVLKVRYDWMRPNSTPLHQVIQEAEDAETDMVDTRKLVLLQDKKEDFRRRPFTPEIQESILEESEQSEVNIVKRNEFLIRLEADVDLQESPRTMKPRMSWVAASESILEEEESQESQEAHQFRHDEFIKRISTYETPMPAKETSVNLVEVCEEEEDK